MNFTAGLLLIFLNVFLPGLIFFRFYYTGEFSKQFSTKVPIIRLAFYALIPGLIFLLIGVLIYNCYDPNFTIYKTISIFSELLGNPKGYSLQTEYFLKNQIDQYSWFTFFLNVKAFILAFIAHWLVRRMGWDIRFKLLRFKNQWYYVFNGDILKYKKYMALNILNPQEAKNTEIMMASADVLVNESGSTSLYSGYIMDYDLNDNDSNTLDKIYLIDAYRYKKNEHLNGSTTVVKKSIPGQIFIILNSNILNINLTYVPSPIHKINQEIKKELKQNKFKLFIKELELPCFLAVFYFSFAIFIKKIAFGPLSYINREFNVFEKIFLIITFLVLITLIFYDDDSKRKDHQKYLQIRKGSLFIIFVQVVIIGIHYLF
jgi:hypothetical protein